MVKVEKDGARSFYCDICGKELCKVRSLLGKESDWFVVKDELWKDVTQRNNIDKRAHLCCKCFEELLGRQITIEDLKLVDGRELPMNYWIVERELLKNPSKVKERLKYLKPALPIYIIHNKFEAARIKLIEMIEKSITLE